MGVSGFLISWAIRWATSCQARAFCARRSSVRSSMTSREPTAPWRARIEESVSAKKARYFAGFFRGKKIAKPFRFPNCVRAKHSLSRRIGPDDAPLWIEGDDAGRDVFQNGFHDVAAVFEFTVGLLDFLCGALERQPVFLQLLRHRIE